MYKVTQGIPIFTYLLLLSQVNPAKRLPTLKKEKRVMMATTLTIILWPLKQIKGALFYSRI